MKAKNITKIGIIAALYALLTLASGLFGLSNGPIQIRLSEALTILPVFTKAAIPGLAIGCLISSIFTVETTVWDILFGSLATLLAAMLTRRFRRHKILPYASPIVINSLIIPMVLVWGTGIELPIWLVAIYIFISEFLSAGLIGYLMRGIVNNNNDLKRMICDD